MRRKIHLAAVGGLLVALASHSPAVELRDQVQVGRAYYQNAEFKKAIAHFERAIKANPADAEAYLWLGKSHAVLAEINGPIFSSRDSVRARFFLSKAVELAPANVEYRRELFDFLVQSSCSPSMLHQAHAMLQAISERDPDYPYMRMQLTEQFSECSSPELRATTIAGFVPRQLIQAADFHPQLRQHKPDANISATPRPHGSAPISEIASITP